VNLRPSPIDTWRLIQRWWTGLSHAAEQRGDHSALVEAEDEAYRAGVMVDIHKRRGRA
jgi:hypothetical protein